MNNYIGRAETEKAEEKLWAMLDLDSVGEQMAEPVVPGNDAHQMGTGHTHNACYQCSNSASTSGCGTCG